ncbi:MAG: hypothetical protein KJO01_05510 [Gammaproteobacteria bacterium]|nr:hypothetical protein [Gammaproteobacteria bacterium]MBT8109296.1 hypothetical protein [Gammaproteobacteria bacterium]NND47769.1 hypothetical protein [Woeseiaceae bacterium]NNL43998.1 hypothetical protein [Woeseiaceae bacterium]
MRNLKLLAVVLFFWIPTLVNAEVSGIPDSATWYFHADFDGMRNGKASRGLYDWLDSEFFEEIRLETGVDFGKEADRLTAFSHVGEGPVVLIEGSVSQDTKDKIIAIAAADGELQTFKSSGKAYYYFNSDNSGRRVGNANIDVDSLEDEAYISVALKNKIVVTNSQEQMKALLANNGKIESSKNEKNTLFVLRAEQSLIQAGVNADKLDAGDGWESNILRSTKQVAVLIADLGDKLGVEAQLLTNEPEIASSLASIVRGLISLQMFNEDMDPEIASILQSTRVDVAGNALRISLAIEPDTVLTALED